MNNGKSVKIEIPANGWKPRLYQQRLWDYMANGGKRSVVVWPRRHGKDLFALNWIAYSALTVRPGSYWHIFPEYQQAKKAIWLERTTSGKRYLSAFPGFPDTGDESMVDSVNNTDLVIQLKNGSVYRMVGADNPDNLVGANPVGIVFSEYAAMNPACWHFLRPIVEANGGWVMFISTPRGRNHFYDLFNYAAEGDGANNNWFSEHLTCETAEYLDEDGNTKRTFSIDQINAIRKEPGVTEEFIRQEYFCSWVSPSEGAYYAKQLMDAEADNRICNVPYSAYLPVATVWDLGFQDYTAIWFYQVERGGIVRVIDFYFNEEEPITHYIRMVNEWGIKNNVIWDRHFAPWDVEHHSIQTGTSVFKIAKSLGFKFTPCAREAVDSGIEAVRTALPKCYFDAKKCDKGLEFLRQYRKGKDQKTDTWSKSPVHDKCSHAADAFRTLAWSLDKTRQALQNRALVAHQYATTNQTTHKWL
jgi:hypothetical protein